MALVPKIVAALGARHSVPVFGISVIYPVPGAGVPFFRCRVRVPVFTFEEWCPMPVVPLFSFRPAARRWLLRSCRFQRPGIRCAHGYREPLAADRGQVTRSSTVGTAGD
jgi:hypothetical protein